MAQWPLWWPQKPLSIGLGRAASGELDRASRMTCVDRFFFLLRLLHLSSHLPSSLVHEASAASTSVYNAPSGWDGRRIWAASRRRRVPEARAGEDDGKNNRCNNYQSRSRSRGPGRECPLLPPRRRRGGYERREEGVEISRDRPEGGGGDGVGSIGRAQNNKNNRQPTSAAEEQGLEGGEAAPVRPRRRRGGGDDHREGS